MLTRKIIVYQRYATKPVILTDSSTQTNEELQKSILNILSTDKLSILETTNDSLIIRPSEVQSILITKQFNGDRESDLSSTSQQEETQKIKHPISSYQEKLKIPEDKK